MGIGVITDLAGLILQGYGIWAQSEADEQARSDALAYNWAEMGLRNRSLASQIEISKDKLAFDKREARRKWKWMEEERGYKRAQDFMGRFQGMLDKEPAFKNNLRSIWGSRG